MTTSKVNKGGGKSTSSLQKEIEKGGSNLSQQRERSGTSATLKGNVSKGKEKKGRGFYFKKILSLVRRDRRGKRGPPFRGSRQQTGGESERHLYVG